LKDEIDLLCLNVQASAAEVALAALDSLIALVKGSTTSMTSVPKPFKFLKNHYSNIVSFYETLQPNIFKVLNYFVLTPKQKLADFLSVLSMTMAEEGKQVSLFYLQQGTMQDFKSWGHEYLHHLSADIGIEYTRLM